MSGIRIRNIAQIGEREVAELGDVLIDCVEGGASVSFMAPMTRAKADAFWRGIAASVARGERIVLAAAEASALEAGKTLLVLDTVSGSDASRLYARNGWQRSGEIPEYALWPDGRPCPTTYYYKFLRQP